MVGEQVSKFTQFIDMVGMKGNRKKSLIAKALKAFYFDMLYFSKDITEKMHIK